MRCPEVRDLVHPFLDGELDVPRNVEMLKHLELCPACRSRCEVERHLLETTASCCIEPLPEETRRRLFQGIQEARRRRRWVPRLVAIAAVLLLALGFGFLTDFAPICYIWGCPEWCPVRKTMEYAAQARLPRGLESLHQVGLDPSRLPHPVGLSVVGCVDLDAPGYPERRALVLRSSRTGRECRFLRIPGAYAHAWQFKTHPDGRSYVEVLVRGSRLVGWQDRGGLAFVVAGEGLSTDRLYVMASAMRDAGA